MTKNELEDQLRELGRTLADKQIARFWKIPEAMQCTPCDFCGYNNKGRAILIEAKMVNRPRLPIGKKPGLSIHQWAELREAERAGAISLLAWQREGYVIVLRASEVAALRDGKSLPWDNDWNERAETLGVILETMLHERNTSFASERDTSISRELLAPPETDLGGIRGQSAFGF